MEASKPDHLDRRRRGVVLTIPVVLAVQLVGSAAWWAGYSAGELRTSLPITQRHLFGRWSGSQKSLFARTGGGGHLFHRLDHPNDGRTEEAF